MSSLPFAGLFLKFKPPKLIDIGKAKRKGNYDHRDRDKTNVDPATR